MKIKKYYEEVVSFGVNSFQSARIGLSLETEKDLNEIPAADRDKYIKQVSNSLFNKIRAIVKEECDILRKERGIDESTTNAG